MKESRQSTMERLRKSIQSSNTPAKPGDKTDVVHFESKRGPVKMTFVGGATKAEIKACGAFVNSLMP